MWWDLIQQKFGLERELSYRPPLGPAVLEPGFDLRVRHLQALGQGGPLGARQVLLPVEALLQLADLNSGEGRAGLFPLGRRPVLVRVSYPSGDGERHQSRCGNKERRKERGREGDGETHRWEERRWDFIATAPNRLIHSPLCMEIRGHTSQISALFDNNSLFRLCKPGVRNVRWNL